MCSSSEGGGFLAGEFLGARRARARARGGSRRRRAGRREDASDEIAERAPGGLVEGGDVADAEKLGEGVQVRPVHDTRAVGASETVGDDGFGFDPIARGVAGLVSGVAATPD